MYLTGEIRDAKQLNALARNLVDRLIPGDIPQREARTLFDELVTLDKIVTAGRTLIAGRVAQSKDWEHDGAASAG